MTDEPLKASELGKIIRAMQAEIKALQVRVAELDGRDSVRFMGADLADVIYDIVPKKEKQAKS